MIIDSDFLTGLSIDRFTWRLAMPVDWVVYSGSVVLCGRIVVCVCVCVCVYVDGWGVYIPQ